MNIPTLPKQKPLTWGQIEIKRQLGLIRGYIIAFSIATLIWFILALLFIPKAQAQTPCPAVNMDIIAEIESNNNPNAYNKHSGACGAFQVTQICLADYNAYNVPQIAKKDLFQRGMGHKVAYWYINQRIPAMLNHYGIKDTVMNRLIAYNWGIKGCIAYNKGKRNLPKETAMYLAKYDRLIN